MSFLDKWERIKTKTSLKNYSELADLVGTTSQYVSRKKKEDEFPVSWAFEIAQKFGLSTEWIMTGKEDRKRKENRIIEEIDEWVTETSGGKNVTWFENQFDRAFPDFVRWKEEKKERNSDSDHFPLSKIA